LIREKNIIYSCLVPMLHEQMGDNQLTNFIFYSQKYRGSDASLIPISPSLTPELQSLIREGGFCTVLDQPIPLDRLVLKNVDPVHITGTYPRAFERLRKYHLHLLHGRQCKGKALCAHKPPPGAQSANTGASPAFGFTALLLP